MVEVALLAVVPIVGAIATLGAIGVRDANPVLAANAAGSLVVALLPPGLDLFVPMVLGGPLGLGPVAYLWVAGAGLIHALGMYGLYESVWWWDQLAHTISAGLLAAVVYASLRVAAESGHGLAGSSTAIVLATVGLTLLLGVLWELLEVVTRDLSRYFGTDPLLVPYGRWDTASDLVFDGVGALLVLAVDVRVFEDAAGRFPDATVALVTVVAWVATVGTLLVGFAVVAYRTELFDGGSRGRSDR